MLALMNARDGNVFRCASNRRTLHVHEFHSDVCRCYCVFIFAVNYTNATYIYIHFGFTYIPNTNKDNDNVAGYVINMLC